MRRPNLLNLFLVMGFFFVAVVGCKSAAEKERDRQNKQARDQKAVQKQKTSDLIQSLKPSADAWAKMAPPLKLVKEPYLKGKVVIVYRRANDINELHENDVIGLGELHAQTPAEVQTLIQTDCFEVRRGNYITKDAEKKQIPAYVSECEVAVIDLSMPATIYRKKFENTELLDEINSTNVDWETIKRKNKVVAPEPQGAIRDFLLSLPRR
ncbi:MAG: hypothetical protein ABR501_14790 [Pyrinomonadaceae bacterium]